MQLHRTTGKPDWIVVPPGSHNLWQRLAVRTHGIGTPSNAVTLVGFVLVLIGLQQMLNQHFLLGTVLLVTGRLCDILDGWLAELTGTKSPLGELLDAAIDKIATILTVVIFIAAHVAPALVLIALATPHILIVIIVLGWRNHRAAFHPSLVGKLSMAGVWLSLVIYALDHAIRLPAAALTVTQVIVVASSAAGFYAATLYARGRD